MGIFDTRQNLTCRGFYQTSGETLTLSGNTKIASVGSLQYCTDQSSKYNARSIPDVAFVTGRTTSANNGLTKLGNNVVLGGALTGNTSLTGNYTLNINSGAKLNSNCGYQISGVTMFDVTRNSLSNVRIGHYALSANTTGCNNTALGLKSLVLNTTGCQNVAIGNYSLSGNTTGSCNFAIGICSLSKNSSGLRNVSIGYATLYNNISGCANIAIGMNSLISNTTGTINYGIGTNALFSLKNGNCNLAIGQAALGALVSGNSNIAIGRFAGCGNISGNKNIHIGNCAGCGELGSGKLYIGTGNTSLIMGDMAQDCVILPKLKLRTVPEGSGGYLCYNPSTCLVEQTIGGTGDKNNIYSTTIITGNSTLTTGSSYVVLVNSPTTISTITLPLTPINNEAFKIKDVSGKALTYNITINGNGRNIDGSSSALINTDYGAVELLYNSSLNAWFAISFMY